ncbi:MAG: zinc ABC transporter substrate-binding protein [Silicimonas sp.]
MRPVILLASLLSTVSLPAIAEVPDVATDIAPVHGLVARVMDGVGTPTLIVPASASVHSHDLRPSEAAALDAADVVFWIGEELSPWFVRPIETLAADAVTVTLLDVEGTRLLPFREEEGFDHEDGHEDEGETHDDHDHGHGEIDPHAWLDPDNASLWMGVIAETLAEADPDNAAAYRENAISGRAEIAEAFALSEKRLQDAGRIRYAVFHDAYQYFENRFGLEPVGAFTLGDAAAPGPARIARLQKQLVRTGADCLLIEPQQNASFVDVFADGGAVRIVKIDPLGVDLPMGSGFYTALLASLTDSFSACR